MLISDMRTVLKIHHPSGDVSVKGRSYTFEMHAGERIWVLASDSDEHLRAWMNSLCRSTGRLELEDKSENGNVVLTTKNPKAALTSRLSSYKSVSKGRGKQKLKKGRRASAKVSSANTLF